MPPYCLLQGQALQEQGCITQAHLVSQVMALFPTFDDDDDACSLGLKRSGRKPTIGTLVSSSYNGLVSAYGHKAK